MKKPTGPVPMKQPWRCIYCAAAGVETVMSTLFCDQIFQVVLDAHEAKDPGCAQAFGDSGLALDKLVSPIPKKKADKDNDQPNQTDPAENRAEAVDEADQSA